MAKEPTHQRIFLKDYQAHDFKINEVFLEFDLDETATIVTSTLKIIRQNKTAKNLVLSGEKLELLELWLNEDKLTTNDYVLSDDSLTIETDLDSFELQTKVKINPKENTALEGLYLSDGQFCTQNEPEGFRKITYFIDRPDNMTSFTTKIIGDKSKYPYLLGNGDKIESGELSGGKHFATWKDPFPKPSYLFALVAGDYDLLKDTYKTMSGKEVSLEIYVDKGNLDKSHFAMESLKKSMKWDEQVFGLEYDLSTYMIVAVDAFNMGAMENKGLNIFNSVYVLAKPQTATDDDYNGIEGVIGHEYFHNWTGNRVTCRDWFQLTLKEGLTVFRDQEFSSDMTDRSVKRIQDVKTLRSRQFPEDAGPMAHPIRPDSYIEINNFYTATIYEKGAEVIRMIHTIVGKENFRKGMDKYFELYDGQAVTTEDFVRSMEEASGIDLTQFRNWYDQVGTPKLKVNESFKDGVYQLSLSQFVDPQKNKENLVLDIPLKIKLYTQDGALIENQKLENYRLNKLTDTIEVKAQSKPIASINCGFSAPVILESNIDFDDYIKLFKFDRDDFNRWDAGQRICAEIILRDGLSETQVDAFISAYKETLNDFSIGNAFKVECLGLPSEADLNDQLSVMDIDGVHAKRKNLWKRLSIECVDCAYEIYKQLTQMLKTNNDRQFVYGARKLKNFVLSMLVNADEKYISELEEVFLMADNMTDELSTLSILLKHASDEVQAKSLKHFYNKWSNDSLIMNKWFSVQSMNFNSQDFKDKIQQLAKNPSFDAKNPNKLRSLYGSFAHANIQGFHAKDGSGYEFVADKIIEIDKINPQVASRLCTAFARIGKVDQNRAVLMKAQLERVVAANISRDSFEIVDKYLKV